MIIWALALVLFGCLGFAGYCFGVIRALSAMVGLLAGLLVASLFGHTLDGALTGIGIKHPGVLQVLGPFIFFLLTLAILKSVGFVVQRKVNLYYKHKASDLRLALWNRLNAVLGLCIGLINAAIYFVLISTVIYVMSYATVQLTPANNAVWYIKALNTAGRNLQSTGMAKITAAIDPMPAVFYDVTDLAGLIYHNPLTEARLARYPAFLGLGETPEFQAIATDTEFRELRQKEPRLNDVWKHPKTQAVVTNSTLVKEVWDLLSPNLKDVEHFLRTGRSQTYTEKIVGRWEFNMNSTLAAIRVGKPTMTSTEMKREKLSITALFSTANVIATPGKQVFLKNFGRYQRPPPGANPAAPAMNPPPRGGRGGPPRGGPPPGTGQTPVAPPVVELRNLAGQWSLDGTAYRIRGSGGVSYSGMVEGDVLKLEEGPSLLVFDRLY